MADLFIKPGQLNGAVEPPPSKSDAHRALLAASLAGSLDRVQGLPDNMSDDLSATRRCLNALASSESLLDCGESGTTLRLLIPVAAALGSGAEQPVIFTGQGRLPQRPLAEYTTIFHGHDIELRFPATGSLPLELRGQLTGGEFAVPGHVSSQYLSGLLFALPLLADDSVIRLTSPLESAPYVDMTLRTLKAFGIVVDQAGGARFPHGGYEVKGRQHYQPTDYRIEKDYSQAAFWLVAAYGGSQLDICGLAADSVQGDRAIMPLLDELRQGQAAYTIDVSQIPDLVPALAVAAALTPATTRLINAGRLRIKESDRLSATEQALRAIGCHIWQDGDSLLIEGGHDLPGGEADSWADHRIAMALAVAALSTRKGVLLHRAEAVRKSYPEFFRELRRLGGEVDGLDLGPHA